MVLRGEMQLVKKFSKLFSTIGFDGMEHLIVLTVLSGILKYIDYNLYNL